MLISHSRDITFRGKPARLYVLRNNGYCWGRVVDDRGNEWDISTQADHYDDTDEDALDAFQSASHRGRCIEVAIGYLFGGLR